MSMDEAKQFNLSEEERRSLVRVDSAKVNLVRASTSAAWFRLASVNLGNGTEEYPAGDNIQVAEPWVPPDMWRDLSPSLCCRIIDELEAGLENGDRYSSSARATTSAAWPIVIKHAEGLNKEQARAVISKWLKSGVLEERPYYSEAQRKDRVGLYANTAKRPGSNAP